MIIDSELSSKFIGYSQPFFLHCRARFYAFFGQPLSKQLYPEICRFSLSSIPMQNEAVCNFYGPAGNILNAVLCGAP